MCPERRVFFISQLITSLSYAVFFNLCLCGQAGKTVLQPFTKIAVPPIVDGELNLYEWFDTERESLTTGYRTVLINRVQSEVPVFKISTTDFNLEHVPTESTVVLTTRDVMTPIVSTVVLVNNETLNSITTSYHGDRAEVVTRIKGEEIRNYIPIGVLTYDVNQLLTLGRAVRIPPQAPLHILVVIPLTTPPGGMSVVARFIRLGGDTISVPAGLFDCERMVLEISGRREFYLYEKGGPRRLISYYDEQSKRGLRLVKTTRIKKNAPGS